MATVTELLVEIGADLQPLRKGMAEVRSALMNTGKDLTSLGSSLTNSLSRPILNFGKDVVKTFTSFQTEMNRVKALTGESGDALESLRQKAKDMGETTQFSATEAAEAMSFMSMAGMKTDEILGAIDPTLALAASGMLDMGTAADIVTNVMTGFGRDLKTETLDTVDKLAFSFTNANTDLKQLGEAFKYAGPIAKASGMSFDETAAVLGKMGNAGFQASMAGTALRGALTRLLNPTRTNAELVLRLGDALDGLGEPGFEFAKVLEAIEQSGIDSAEATELFGMTLEDAEKTIAAAKDGTFGVNEAMGLFGVTAGEAVGILGDMTEGAMGAGDMMNLFGMRAGPALLALLGQGSEAVRSFTEDISKADGTANRIKETMEEGLPGAFKKLESAWAGFQLALAESGLDKWLESILLKLTDLVKELARSDPALLKLATAVGVVLMVLGPLLWILGQIVWAVGALWPVLTAIGSAFAAVGALVAAGAVAIGVLIGAFAAIIIYWDEWTVAVWEAIDSLGWFGEMITWLSDWVVERWDFMWNSVQTIFDTVSAAVKAGWETWTTDLAGEQASFGTIISENWSITWETMKDYASRTWEWLKTQAKDLWTRMKEDAGIVWASIVDMLSTAWKGIKSTAASVWEGIKNAIVGAFDGVKEGIRAALNYVIGLMNQTIAWANALITRLNQLPHVSIAPIDFTIPELAEGGIAMGPMLAMIGEAGSEAVIPLDRIGDLIPGGGGGGDTYVFNIGGDVVTEERLFRSFRDKMIHLGKRNVSAGIP